MNHWAYKISLCVLLSLKCSITLGQGSSIDSVIKDDCGKEAIDIARFFDKVENVSQFKGFPGSWFQFAKSRFDFHSVLQSLPDSIQLFNDSVLVRFIVTIDGSICGVNYLSGNELLFEPVAKLLYSSPKWKAATNGGLLVSAFRNLQLHILIDKRKLECKVVNKYDSYYPN